MPVDKARLATLFDFTHERKQVVTEQTLSQVLSLCLPHNAILPETAPSLIAAFVQANPLPPAQIKALLLADDCELTSALLGGSAAAAAAAPQAGGKTILEQDLGEDDEDDEDEAEDGAAGGDVPAVVQALLRGFIKVQEGKLVWSGHWADSAEKFEAGTKYKFRLQFAGKEDVAGCMEGESIVKPLSGAYVGSFLVVQPPSAANPDGLAKVDEINVKLEFTGGGPAKWTFTGQGSNVYGNWTIQGELDGKSRRMAGIKTYAVQLGGSSDDDDDDDDDDGGDDDDDLAEEEDEVDPNELDDLKKEAELAVGDLAAKYNVKRLKR